MKRWQRCEISSLGSQMYNLIVCECERERENSSNVLIALMLTNTQSLCHDHGHASVFLVSFSVFPCVSRFPLFVSVSVAMFVWVCSPLVTLVPWSTLLV